MVSRIVGLANKHYPFIRRLRRYLHQYPELSFEEFETSKKLREVLGSLGLAIRESKAGNGFTALLKGCRKGRVAAFRTDMDALSVTEETDLPFRSRHKGRMHACGHDMHMSIAVGIALVLSGMREEFAGAVKFLFQPGEESPPGGAVKMIEEGALESPRVDSIFALHVDPAIPVGKLGIREGVMMAHVVDLELTVIGVGGHAARPDQSVDAIVVAANLVSQLQSLVSRHIDPLEPAVLTFGTIEGGSARNSIAKDVTLQGTMRSLSKKTMTRMQRLFERTCRHVTRSSGGTFEVRYIDSYPQLENDRKANDFIRAAACELFGRRSVIELDVPIMGAEDFARYLEHVPGAMFRLGVGNRKIGAVYPWHHGKFMADESAMKIGVAVSAKAILDFLGS